MGAEGLIAIVLFAIFVLIVVVVSHERTIPLELDAILSKAKITRSCYAYRLDTYRQSGALERSQEYRTLQGAVSQGISTLIRAKAHGAIISTNTERALKVHRDLHNNRGRQEGKRIGSFVVSPISNLNDSL